MNQLRKLVPAFLWEWDLRLLQDRPRLWATRFHLHLWFLVLINLVTLVLGLLIGVSHRKFPEPEALFGYMLVPATAYFCFWLYRVARFNVEKRFGERKPYSDVAEFVVLWVSMLLIFSIPYTLAVTVAQRAAALTPDEEFVAEVDLLGEQSGWFYGHEFLYDRSMPGLDYSDDYEQAMEAMDLAVQNLHDQASGRLPQGAGTHRFYRSLKEYHERDDDEARAAHADFRALHDVYEGYLRFAEYAADPEHTESYNLDSATWYNAKADSIERNFPLLLMEHGFYRPWSDLPFKSDSVLEAEYIAKRERNEAMDLAAIDRVLAIGIKYSEDVRPIGSQQVSAEYEARFPSTANLQRADRQITRIAKAKDMRYFFWKEEGFFYFMVIFTFCFAILLSAFKSIYWQPFLIAVVTGAVVPVIVLVLSLILEHDVIPLNDGDIMLYGHWLIAVFLFAMLFTIHQQRAYRTNRAVMVILANAIIPFFALYTLMILHEKFDIFGAEALNARVYDLRSSLPNENDPRIMALEAEALALREWIAMVIQITLWGGIAVYVFALHPLFRGLYARLLAFPERK